MSRFAILVMGLGMAATMHVAAQQPGEGRMGDRRPPREEGRPGRSETLTDAQKEQVKTILSKYDAASLTAEDARAIHEAFRQAGLRGGPAMGAAIKAAGFDPERLRELAPPPGQSGGGDRRPPSRELDRAQGGNDRSVHQGAESRGQGRYSIEQAVSDRAQLNTIAFDGLAFLTGDFGCNTFLPPGKVADFCGFQYMRDVDTNELGHNTSFVPRAANNVLYALTDAQKAKLIALAREQEKMLTDFVQKRFPLIKAFCRQLEGDFPSGSAGLSREAVMKYTAGLYEIDGLLSHQRAEVLGGIVRSLTEKQKEYLGKMVFNNSSTWPEMKDQVDKKSMSHTAHVAVMTYASEMLSWYAGNVEADVYFCPERHATYFGSFYMKDIPAMGNANFSISTSLTGDSGEAFLATLTEPQRQLVTGLVDRQRADLAEIVKTRRAIATELRRFMKEATVDKDGVLALSRRYGELDGEISYFYAMTFAQVARILTAEQKKALLKLRNLDAKYTCKGAYLYSQAIEMPAVPETDFLFSESAMTAPAAAASVAPLDVSSRNSN
jgi:Spy/CpxP family protein refolding chaperone